MINTKKRDVKNAAQELKDRLKANKGEPDFKSELIPGKNSKSKPYGVKVFAIINKKIRERIIKLFNKVKRNGIDLTESFSNELEALSLELLFNRSAELRQCKSEPHFFQFYDAVNELHILTREGCKAYGIKLPEPEKVSKAKAKPTKPELKKKDTKKAPTTKPGAKKKLIKTPANLKSLLAKKKAKAKKK